MKATLDSYSLLFMKKSPKYCIAGNFRGVLIFVIFVTIPRVMKFSTHEIYSKSWLYYLARVVSASLMRIDIVNCTNISELKQVVYVYYLHQQSYVDKEL